MAFATLKSWRARSAAQAARAAHLKGEIAAALDLTEADALNVNEIACPDPHCPTRFRITRLGKRVFRHIDTTAVPLPAKD